MNILLLSDGFPPLSNAGAEKIAYLFAKEYCARGHQVSIITINTKLANGEIRKTEYDGMDLFHIGSSYNRYLRSYLSLYNPWVLNAIRSILKSNDFNLAHLHNIHEHISYGVISLLKKNKMISILTAHDAMSVDYGKFTQGVNPFDYSSSPKVKLKLNPLKTFLNYKRSYNPFRNIIIKYYLDKVYKIITVSHEQELLLNANGIKKTLTINNGITAQEQKISESQLNLFKNKHNIQKGDSILLWAGRLSQAKGAEQVLNVVEELILKKYKFKLLVAGRNVFKGHKFEKYIISTGWLDEYEMRLAYNASDVTLVPSICYDMFPTVVLESMQEGTPVIAGCFGGAKEVVIDGEMGYIINPFNKELFFEKVCQLLDNKTLRESLSIKSVERFKDHFTIERCVEDYLSLIDSILKNN